MKVLLMSALLGPREGLGDYEGAANVRLVRTTYKVQQHDGDDKQQEPIL